MGFHYGSTIVAIDVCACFIICVCVIRFVCVKKSVCLYSDLQVKTNQQTHAKICECIHRSVSVHISVNAYGHRSVNVCHQLQLRQELSIGYLFTCDFCYISAAAELCSDPLLLLLLGMYCFSMAASKLFFSKPEL